jgi:CRP-like cAMP-binding protein
MLQLVGAGLRIPFTALQTAFDPSDEIRKRVLEFVRQQAAAVAQVAGCNRLHSSEQRLSRRLLMAHDRTLSPTLKFTQEYLAEMTGTQRTTVTIIAGLLQTRGLISYVRGIVCIINCEAFEKTACECYFVTKHLYDNLYLQKTNSDPNLAA